MFSRVRCSLGSIRISLADTPRQMGPSVLHQVLGRSSSRLVRREILQPAVCQPGVAIEENQPGSIGALARTSTEEGVR